MVAGFRTRVVRIAEDEVGSTDATKYWKEVLPGKHKKYPEHWCGAFVLWCLRRAGLCDWTWEIGSGLMWPKGAKEPRLPVTSYPKPGDVAYVEKFQHHCLVMEAVGSVVATVDGNSGYRKGGEVVLNQRPVSSFASFYDISPLIFGEPYG